MMFFCMNLASKCSKKYAIHIVHPFWLSSEDMDVDHFYPWSEFIRLVYKQAEWPLNPKLYSIILDKIPSCYDIWPIVIGIRKKMDLETGYFVVQLEC